MNVVYMCFIVVRTIGHVPEKFHTDYKWGGNVTRPSGEFLAFSRRLSLPLGPGVLYRLRRWDQSAFRS